MEEPNGCGSGKNVKKYCDIRKTKRPVVHKKNVNSQINFSVGEVGVLPDEGLKRLHERRGVMA